MICPQLWIQLTNLKLGLSQRQLGSLVTPEFGSPRGCGVGRR